MGALSDLIASASLREVRVSVCVAGKLNAELAELTERRAEEARSQDEGLLSSGAVSAELAALDEKIEAVKAEMRAATAVFTMRALPRTEWTTFVTRSEFQPRKGKQEPYNADAFPRALIAKCCVAINDQALTEPLTLEEVDELLGVLNSGQTMDLVNAGFAVNNEGVDVPF